MLTVDAARHAIHLLVVAVVEEPDGGITVVFFERDWSPRSVTRSARKKAGTGKQTPAPQEVLKRTGVAVGHVKAPFLVFPEQDANYTLTCVLQSAGENERRDTHSV
jgi:hypothetical protein